jgi:hypothetical protein
MFQHFLENVVTFFNENVEPTFFNQHFSEKSCINIFRETTAAVRLGQRRGATEARGGSGVVRRPPRPRRRAVCREGSGERERWVRVRERSYGYELLRKSQTLEFVGEKTSGSSAPSQTAPFRRYAHIKWQNKPNLKPTRRPTGPTLETPKP